MNQDMLQKLIESSIGGALDTRKDVYVSAVKKHISSGNSAERIAEAMFTNYRSAVVESVVLSLRVLDILQALPHVEEDYLRRVLLRSVKRE